MGETVEVLTATDEKRTLPLSAVHTRTGAFRVLAASGGFQRGVIAELRTDGARHSQHSARSVHTPDAPFSRRLFSRHVWWTANGASRPLPAARGE